MEDKELCNGADYIIGVDEVGRGPLAGPVVTAGALINSKTFNFKQFGELGVTDSKKLTEKKRKAILEFFEIDYEYFYQNTLLQRDNFSLSLKFISEKEIDEMNILQASLYGMAQCALAFQTEASVLVDGPHVPKVKNDRLTFIPVIKGDTRCVSIGLASILAKTVRDEFMKKLSFKYPEYGFEKHAGYPTKFHKLAIKKYGVTKVHRKTFKGVKEFL